MSSKRDLKELVATRIEFFKRKPEAAIYRPKVSSKHIRNLYTETLQDTCGRQKKR